MDFISLNKLPQNPEKDEFCNGYFKVCVIDCGKPQPYKSAKRGEATMLQATCADITKYDNFIFYAVDHFPLIKKNESIIIKDVIKKPNGNIAVTVKSDVFVSSPLEVPQDLRENYEKETKSGKIWDVADAAISPQKTTITVCGQVVACNKTTTKRIRETQEEVKFKRIKIKDNTGSINVALWRDMADTEIVTGNCVKLLNFSRTSKFDHILQSQKPVLGSKPTGSSIEFIPDIDDVSSTDDSEDEDQSKVTGQVLGVQSLYLYSCCINPPCCKKKLQNNICTTCNMHYTAASAGSAAVCKILLQRNGMMMQTFTMFTELIQSLLSSMDCDTSLDSTTVSRIVNKIPFTVSYIANGNKLSQIKYIS